jgi:hypothetical protein
MSTTTLASTRPRGRHRRRHLTVVAAVALLVGVAAACEPDTVPPSWTVVHRAHATNVGPHVLLEWDAATGVPSRYRIDVNGVTATLVQPAATSCVMVGLAASTAHTFRITAYDAAGNWSDPLPPDGQHDPGHRSASATTPSTGGGGSTLRCVPAADTDADRIPDALEGGVGSSIVAPNVLTVPTDPDTDDDGMDDGDEAYGTVAGLPLPAYGVRPWAKDVLVEIDWAATPAGCSVDLGLTAAEISPVVNAFYRIPVSSPGGYQGIKLIVDHGQGGVFTGGEEYTEGDGGLYGSGDYDPKADHFDPKRKGYFRYARIGTEIVYGASRPTGLGERGGDDMWFGFGCQSPRPVAVEQNMLMHELGHNLDLAHGGHDDVNRKRNYNSIMNYWYLGIGVDQDCDFDPDGGPMRLAYSDEVLAPFDENHIDELAGLCPGIPADFNVDQSIATAPYAQDVNGDGLLNVHEGSNDIENMDVGAFTDSSRVGGHPIVVDVLP